jgi:alpha-glucosidase
MSRILLLIFLGISIIQVSAQEYTLLSPDEKLVLKISIDEEITYSVTFDDQQLVQPSIIGMSFDNEVILGQNATVLSTTTRSVNGTIEPFLGKNSVLQESFNERVINFDENYSLVMRAYDEGVAYRFITNWDENVKVTEEVFKINIVGDPGVIFPEADGDMRSWERSYDIYETASEIRTNKFAITPLMFTYPSNVKLVVAESDLFDYPGLYVIKTEEGLEGKWAHYPKTVSSPNDLYAYHRVLTRENYIATTKGSREYPWRVFIATDQDKDLLNNELIYKLAKPSVLTNTSYVKAGKSAWEWWHDALLELPSIPSGPNNLNYNVYKVYVDFAAQNKLEFITMDAGWTPEVAKPICDYAATKGIKVFLWDFINLAVVDPNRLTYLKSLGAAGIKVDLIERDDQIAINWMEQLAKDCAERELMIIYHGNSKPTGLQRTYPNIVNFEAVRGEECFKWDNSPNPEYRLLVPFIRMLAGPLDFTPGSMRNVHRSQFSPVPVGIPQSIGTRAHELALYVMFDHTVAYLCDSPTEYRKYGDIMTFLGNVPTVWHETVPLEAVIGKYAVIAKRNEGDWFVGAMTNSEAREVEIDFSFLPAGVERVAEVFRDNEGTAANAKSYTFERVPVTNQSKITYRLEEGGGVAIRIREFITGIEHIGENSIKIYPNESGTELIVQADENIQSVILFDIQGVNHFQDKNISTSETRINIAQLKRGVYIAFVTTKGVMQSFKFLKE